MFVLQVKSQALARATGFDEFAHRQFVAAIAALGQSAINFGAAIRQQDVATEQNCVAREPQSLVSRNFDQPAHVFANGSLRVFIECGGKPHRAAIAERAEARVEVIEPRVHKFDGNRETLQKLAQPLM